MPESARQYFVCMRLRCTGQSEATFKAEQLTLPSRLKRGGKDVEVEQEMEASHSRPARATA